MTERLTERIAVAVLAALGILSLLISPWVALARQTGAKSAVLLLPDRFIDFTGRTDALNLSGLSGILVFSYRR